MDNEVKELARLLKFIKDDKTDQYRLTPEESEWIATFLIERGWHKVEPVKLEVLGDDEIDNLPLVKKLLAMDDARCRQALSDNPQNPNYSPFNVPIMGIAKQVSQATIDKYPDLYRRVK